MAVDDEDPAEAGARDAFDQVARDGQQRLNAQADAAGEGGEVGGEAEGHRRIDRHAERLRRLHRYPLREDRVHAERELRMLLGAAKRQHAAVVAAQIGLDMHPVAVGDPHAVTAIRA